MQNASGTLPNCQEPAAQRDYNGFGQDLAKGDEAL
jgi:hypothetical protein